MEEIAKLTGLAEDFRLAQQGDRAAFGRVRRRLEAPLVRFVRRLLGPESGVDDVLQDAFLALYMNLERVDPVEKARPFLYRIVRNLCYDELRRRGRYDVTSLEAGPQPAWGDHTPAVPAAERLHWCLVYDGVRDAIDRLPGHQREAMLLYCGEKLSYREMAEALNVSLGTVKSRMYYARENLVKILGPETLEGLGLGKPTEEGDTA